jgi:hypothetical protein
MKQTLFLLITILLVSCNAEKKLQRKQKRKIKELNELVTENPFLLETERDTLVIFRFDTVRIAEQRFDTTITKDLQSKTDTIYIENERIKTKIIRVPNFVTNQNEYKVEQEVKEIIKIVNRTDTIFTIKEKFKTEYVIENHIPFWIWLILCFVILFCIVLVIRAFD